MGLGTVVAWWRRRTGAGRASGGGPAADAGAGQLPEAGATAAPARLGRFELLAAVGRGAYSEVFKARDTTSGATCALKIWAAPGAGVRAAQESVERFTAEADLRRRLTHPDIQALLDASLGAERPWMALEWVAGCELARYTQPARLLPPALVAQVGVRIADALHHAHRQGVVHRDLKPANVLVDLARGVVKVVDFGVAHQDLGDRTRTGVLLGSPAYMAPEQLAGAAADARGDLYSLGVMLFELLAGRLPFEAPSMGELLRRVAGEPPPDLLRLRPDLPAALARVVSRALSKDPARRPADASEMARALRDCAADATPPGDPPP